MYFVRGALNVWCVLCVARVQGFHCCISEVSAVPGNLSEVSAASGSISEVSAAPGSTGFHTPYTPGNHLGPDTVPLHVYTVFRAIT